jgi:hypothetical protein
MMQRCDHQRIGAITALGFALAALALLTLVAMTPAMTVAGLPAAEAGEAMAAMDHDGMHHTGDTLAGAEHGGSSCTDCGACVGLAAGLPPATPVAAQDGLANPCPGIPASAPDSRFRPPVISL